MVKIVASLLCLLVSCLGNATADSHKSQRCSDNLFVSAGRHLQVKNFSDQKSGGIVVSAVCKAWPHNNNLLLLAFAYDTATEHQKKLFVAVFDSKAKRIVQTYKRDIEEDALTQIGESSLRLDTARYQLSKEVMAFGLRFQSTAIGPSCGDFASGDELTLFVPEGTQLREIFNLPMYRQRWLKGCRSSWQPGDNSEEAFLTISMKDTATKGYADLLVTAKIDGSGNGELADALAKKNNRTERHTFQYDGKTYQRGKPAAWWVGY